MNGIGAEPTLIVPASIAPPRGSELVAGLVVSDRYVLQTRLGRGGFGEVWRADDTFVGETVAWKHVPVADPLGRAAVRREIAALRLLCAPQAVRLIDDGEWDKGVFIVTELIDGAPFDAAALEHTDVLTLATRLLRALHEIHAAGIVHGDLKPDNVLFTRDGQVRVLDFGLAALRGQGHYGQQTGLAGAGTMAWLAPEQLSGRLATSSSDLHAAGQMLYALCTGHPPHYDHDARRVALDRRAVEPADPVAALAPAMPRRLARAVDAMLRPDPRHRPASAALLLNALTRTSRGAAARARLLASRPSMRWFVGADPIFHAAARTLHALRAESRRAGTTPARRLVAWERAGLVCWNGAAFNVTAAGLERLVAGRDAPHALSRRPSLKRAERLANRGAVNAAISEICAVLANASPHLARHALSLWLELGVAVNEPTKLDTVLHAATLRRDEDPVFAAIESLARVAAGALESNGSGQPSVDSALVIDDPRLELCRHTIRVHVAFRSHAASEQAHVREFNRWAQRSGDARARARALHVRARHAYRLGGYARAARDYALARELEPWRVRQVACSIGLAAAAIEAGHTADAMAASRRALRDAEQLGLPRFEAHAWSVMRMIEFRGLRTRVVDHALIAAVQSLAVGETRGLIMLTEAAIARSAGDLDLARSLATRARRELLAHGSSRSGLLAIALEFALGAAVTPLLCVALDHAYARCTVPEIRLQAAALLASARRRPDGLDIDALVRAIAPSRRRRRLDILSVPEALAMLDESARRDTHGESP